MQQLGVVCINGPTTNLQRHTWTLKLRKSPNRCGATIHVKLGGSFSGQLTHLSMLKVRSRWTFRETSGSELSEDPVLSFLRPESRLSEGFLCYTLRLHPWEMTQNGSK